MGSFERTRARAIQTRQGGFSLLEIAVAVAILGLILGALLVPLATQVDVRDMRGTREQLREAKEALLGFAVVNDNRLPCPDTDDPPDGVADGPPCDGVEGYLPWATLGLSRVDAWGRPLRYRADNAYTQAGGVPASNPDTTSDLEVQDRDDNPLTAGNPDAPVAIIFSCGKNGIPDEDNDDDDPFSANADADCSNPDAPGNDVYTQDLFSEDQFDDMLIWLSKYTLLNRLVAAERWP